jgi:hypothetical protein
MTTTKIRTIIATVAAAFTVAVVPAAAQAAPRPGIHIPPHVVKTVIAEVKDAGSAGIPGYDDAKCQSLLEDYNLAVETFSQELEDGHGGSSRGMQAIQIAKHAKQEMSDNCLVVD